MAADRTSERSWKEDTLDYMFRELVQSEEYRYLLSAKPNPDYSKVARDEERRNPNTEKPDDRARNLFTSTPSDKPPSLENYVKEPERPSVPIDVKH